MKTSKFALYVESDSSCFFDFDQTNLISIKERILRRIQARARGDSCTPSRISFEDGSSARRRGPIHRTPTSLRLFGSRRGIWAAARRLRPWTMAAPAGSRSVDTPEPGTATWAPTKQVKETTGKCRCSWTTTPVVQYAHQGDAIADKSTSQR